jgi:hypothetical protein
LLEKTSVKLLPILKELKRKMAFEEENPPNTNSRSSANKENDRKRT